MQTKKYKAALLLRTTQIADWSGVPYYIWKSFTDYYGDEALVIVAYKYFYLPGYVYNKYYARFVKYCYRLFGIKIKKSFDRSRIYRLIMRLLLIRNSKQINQAQYLFTLLPPFGINKRLIKVPVLTFSDGSYEHLIRWVERRELTKAEKRVEGIAMKVVQKCASVVCMFPNVYDELIDKGLSNNQLILFEKGLNLVRNEIEINVIEKYSNNIVLFIGRKHYKDGALKLIDAFKEARKTIPGLKLVIVGMAEGELSIPVDNGIVVHPYLDKSKPDDLLLYQSSLRNASLIVNVAEIGGSYMTVIEAMAYHTPFILKANPELNLIFQNAEPSGVFLEGDVTPHDLAEEITALLSNFSQWELFSKNAFNTVSEFNWKHLFPKIEDFIKN